MSALSTLCVRSSARAFVVAVFAASALLVACDDSGGPQAPCDGVGCSDRGFCFARSGIPFCDCESGYVPDGLACRLFDLENPCDGVGCDGLGSCVVDGGTPRCDCFAGAEADESGLHCFATGEPLPDGGPDDVDCTTNILYEEDFEDGEAELFRIELGVNAESMSGRVGDGVYLFEGGAGGGGATIGAFVDETFTDVRVEADVSIVETPYTMGYAGIAARFSSEGCGYLLHLDIFGRWLLLVFTEGSNYHLATRNTRVELGRTYHVVLEMIGSEIYAEVDGVVLFSGEDDTHAEGWAGLTANSCTATGDNLRITACE